MAIAVYFWDNPVVFGVFCLIFTVMGVAFLIEILPPQRIGDNPVVSEIKENLSDIVKALNDSNKSIADKLDLVVKAINDQTKSLSDKLSIIDETIKAGVLMKRPLQGSSKTPSTRFRALSRTNSQALRLLCQTRMHLLSQSFQQSLLQSLQEWQTIRQLSSLSKRLSKNSRER